MAKINETNIYENGIFLNLRVSKWGAKAKIDPSSVGVDSDKKDVISTVQELLLKKDLILLKEVKKIGSKLKRDIRYYSIPFDNIASLFFIRLNNVDFIEQKIQQAQKELDEILDVLIRNYEEAKRKFKKKHPDIYDEKKYPSKWELKDKFKIYHSWKMLTPPNKTPSKEANELFKKEWDKFKNEIDEMKETALQMVSAQIIQKLSSLQEQCDNEKVNAKTINTINKFLDRYDEVFKDFIDNKKMKKIIGEVKKFIETDIEVWKENTDFQSQISNQISDIVTQVTKLQPKTPKRRSIEL